MKSQWNSLSKLGVLGIDDVNVHSKGDLYVTKYIDKAETTQEQRPNNARMDQFVQVNIIYLNCWEGPEKTSSAARWLDSSAGRTRRQYGTAYGFESRSGLNSISSFNFTLT